MIPKGYKTATEDDVGKECNFSDYDCGIGQYYKGFLHSIDGDCFILAHDDGRNYQYKYCVVEEEPQKTIALDPMLEERFTDIDHMILVREIELRLLRRMKGEAR